LAPFFYHFKLQLHVGLIFLRWDSKNKENQKFSKNNKFENLLTLRPWAERGS